MQNDLREPIVLQCLADTRPELERILTRWSVQGETPPLFSKAEIRRETVWVTMRDGVRLATDLYLPPARPAPAIAARTPYNRALRAETYIAFARRGYIVIAQDCRGTGDSEPDFWDYYMYEPEDSVDFVEWATQQEWFDGFLGSCGGSYVGSTQWMMARHPRMSAIAPEVAGLCLAPSDEPSPHTFQHAYARSVGKGQGKVPIHYTELERLMMAETLATGYFNDPLHVPFRPEVLERYPQLRTLSPTEGKRYLWEQFRILGSAQRAEFVKLVLGETNVTTVSLPALINIFGHGIPFGFYILPSAL